MTRSLKATVSLWASRCAAARFGPAGRHQLRWCEAAAPDSSGLICPYSAPQRETGIINRSQTPTTGRTESFRGATREERQQMKCNCNGSREAGLACWSHWCVWERWKEWAGPDVREWGSKWKTQRLDGERVVRSGPNKARSLGVSDGIETSKDEL